MHIKLHRSHVAPTPFYMLHMLFSIEALHKTALLFIFARAAIILHAKRVSAHLRQPSHLNLINVKSIDFWSNLNEFTLINANKWFIT